MIVSAANDALFAAVRGARTPEWARDERFATNAARLRNRAEIDRLIGERLATDNRATWQARLQAAGIPVAPIQTTAEVVAHRRRTRSASSRNRLTTRSVVALPLSFDGKRPPPLHTAHDIGADNASLDALLRTGR